MEPSPPQPRWSRWSPEHLARRKYSPQKVGGGLEKNAQKCTKSEEKSATITNGENENINQKQAKMVPRIIWNYEENINSKKEKKNQRFKS